VAHIVFGFREVRRVLRNDGTLWLNFGDTAATGAGKVSQCPGGGFQGETFKKHFGKHTPGASPAMSGLTQPNRMPLPGLKPKNLVGIPWRVAFALQADGWFFRMDNIWAKSNPMPESAKDRPSRAHEYMFLLTKGPKYFYDAYAIMEAVTGNAHSRGEGVNPKANGRNSRMVKERTPRAGPDGKANKPNASKWNVKQNASFSVAVRHVVGQRNKRSVWTVAVAPFRGAHYATFPPRLVAPCILAGTSARGCCAKCGAPYKRIVQKEVTGETEAWRQQCGADAKGKYLGTAQKEFLKHRAQDASAVKARILAGMAMKRTVGWDPTCQCEQLAIVPAVVLDPFAGSGTVGQVAIEYGRSVVLIELSETSIGLIKDRCNNITPSLAIW